MARSIDCMGVVGTGVMGSGIAQIAAQAGLSVILFDARDGAAALAKDNLAATFAKLADKGKISTDAAQAALSRLTVAGRLDDLAQCDLVVEAIVERIEAKQELWASWKASLQPIAFWRPTPPLFR